MLSNGNTSWPRLPAIPFCTGSAQTWVVRPSDLTSGSLCLLLPTHLQGRKDAAGKYWARPSTPRLAVRRGQGFWQPRVDSAPLLCLETDLTPQGRIMWVTPHGPESSRHACAVPFVEGARAGRSNAGLNRAFDGKDKFRRARLYKRPWQGRG